MVRSCLLLPAALLTAASALAQAQEALYAGDLSCGPLLSQPTQPGWTVPVVLRVREGRVSWLRGDASYEETGETAWSASGDVRIPLRGAWKASSGRSGGWGGTASLQVGADRVSGSAVQTTSDGSQRTRECTVAAARQSGSLTAALAAPAPAPGTAPSAASPPVPLLAQAGAPRWKDAPTYDPRHAADVLKRSTFFLPMFGAVYPAKFEALLGQLPPTSLRGVVIYNHGCGGQWGWETTVSQYFYRWGFAVVAPDFLGRDGNRSGCPGGTQDEALRMAGQRAAEGTYQAINPARLAARGQDVQNVITWLKARTRLPIVLAGHSEGCRTVYAMHVTDPQVVGGACVKQGLQPNYEHTWRWNTDLPMWQSLEESDPWVVGGGLTVSQVTFTRKFTRNPGALTVVVVPGNTHDPLNHESERASLQQWLAQRVPQAIVPGQNGVDYEKLLPRLHERMRAGS